MFYFYKFIHIAVIGLFLWVAKLQINDPDPLFWCTLYLLTALTALIALVRLPAAKQALVLALASGFCLAGIFLTFPGASEYLMSEGDIQLSQGMNAQNEEAREFIGALVALIAILAYWFVNKRNQGK